MEDILLGLNDQQRCAVTSPSNVLQVLAPPGSGKTKTLTARVAYHIAHEGVKPWNMIVCTFTIKAAREMKTRIRNFVGDEFERKLVLGTFHSVARRYLSTYGQHIGVPNHFGIADSNDSLAMIKRIIKKNKFAMEPAKARSRISRRKSGVVKERRVGARVDVEQEEFEAISAAYEQELKDAKLLDYDDLLLRCVELLTKFPECVSNIEAVLIDEFQDTNHVQYELMQLFAQHRHQRSDDRIPKITIVGDPDQSIYSFRSAEIENLTRMQKKYTDTQVVHLEENYRSSGSILQFAIEVIEQDTARPQKSLQATHSVGQSPVLRILTTANAEAAWIVSEIRRSLHLNAGLFTYADYAVLLRSASLSRLIETELGKAGIPYRMVGGHKFFDRVEVRILLDYLRVISQPDHNDALLRVVNVPSRKLGDGSVKMLLEECDIRKKPLWQIIRAVAQGNLKTAGKLSQQATFGLESFVNIILTAQQRLVLARASIVDLLAHVMQKIKYESFLRDTYKQEYEDRAANVDELVQLAQTGRVFAEQEEELIEVTGIEQATSDIDSPTNALAQFLANIALATDADKHDAEASGGKVVISTIHAAKGLEWPVVFIPAAYEGSIPHSRAEDVDEERRLLYVGMTRAKALLYLSWPKKSSKTESTSLSPFLSTPSMARYYGIKGPSFGWQVTRDLAGILGRECPSNQAVNERYRLIGTTSTAGIRAEDDEYPEDGEDLGQYNLPLHDTYTAEELDHSYGLQGRKRKFSETLQQGRATHKVTAATSFAFVSARTIADQVETTTNNSEAFIIGGANKTKAYTSSQMRKRVENNQRDIKAFFSAPRNEVSPAEPPSSMESRSTRSEEKGFATLHATTLYKGPVPKYTANGMSGALRNLHNQPVHRRPRIETEHEAERPSHILLSSSPTKAEDSTRVGKSGAGVENETARASHLNRPEHQVGSVTSSILHQTSMQKLSRLQNRPGARKTIGNRPIPGDHVNARFRPPTMR